MEGVACRIGISSCKELEKVMLERGPVMEVIMDNGNVYRSEIFQMMLKK